MPQKAMMPTTRPLVAAGDWDYLANGNIVIVNDSRQNDDLVNLFGGAAAGNHGTYRVVTPANAVVKGYSLLSSTTGTYNIWHGVGVTANGFADPVATAQPKFVCSITAVIQLRAISIWRRSQVTRKRVVVDVETARVSMATARTRMCTCPARPSGSPPTSPKEDDVGRQRSTRTVGHFGRIDLHHLDAGIPGSLAPLRGAHRRRLRARSSPSSSPGVFLGPARRSGSTARRAAAGTSSPRRRSATCAAAT